MARRDLDNKRIIITGASSGIGFELANQLANVTSRLLLTARREDRLQDLANALRDNSSNVQSATSSDEENANQYLVVPGDICDPACRLKVIETAVHAWGGIDVLINNAGVGAIGAYVHAQAERLRKVMEVNFFAPAELTRMAIPYMHAENRPLIVNVSSVLGHRAVPLKSEYCASKFALHGFSDALRAELVESGIDVLLVSPSTTDSEFFDSVLENSTGKPWKLSQAQSPTHVARKTIAAMKNGRNEIILSWSGWGLVWLDRLFPTLANRIVARFTN